MRPLIVALVPLALLLVPAAPAAGPPKEELVDKVRDALQEGQGLLLKPATRPGGLGPAGVGKARPGGFTPPAPPRLAHPPRAVAGNGLQGEAGDHGHPEGPDVPARRAAAGHLR